MSLETLWSGVSYEALANVYDMQGPQADWEAWLAAHPSASVLLWEAVEPLYAAFLCGCFDSLRAQLLIDGSETMVKVTVQLLPGSSCDNPELALAIFDNAFWLHTCELAEGLVVFDYEVERQGAGLAPFVSAYY